MAAARTAPSTAVKRGIIRERIVASSVGRMSALQAVARPGPRRRVAPVDCEKPHRSLPAGRGRVKDGGTPRRDVPAAGCREAKGLPAEAPMGCGGGVQVGTTRKG